MRPNDPKAITLGTFIEQKNRLVTVVILEQCILNYIDSENKYINYVGLLPHQNNTASI